MKRIWLIIICLIVIIGCIPTNALAAESGITPYYNNTMNTLTDFYISEKGVATVYISFNGYVRETTGATIKTTIEKRFLLVFWNEVASWTDEVVGDYYSNTHSTTVKKGTYRATVEYTIRGTGGEPDVIVDEYEYTYE